MSDNRVILNVEKGVAKVILNRADKHNALDLAMFKAIENTIKKISSRPDIRVVIVSGAGESFCSGLDVKSVLSSARNALKLLFKWLPGNANLAQRVTVGWRRLHVPVIMVLHGKCWGGGMQIALGGDYRIAAAGCSLSIMEARWGLIPDMGGTLGLRECVGGDHALKLAITAQTLSAEQAKSIGLISEVAISPFETAQNLAEQICERSPDSTRKIKKMYHNIWCGNERRILAQETFNQLKILMGKNQHIAVKREQGKKQIHYKL